MPTTADHTVQPDPAARRAAPLRQSPTPAAGADARPPAPVLPVRLLADPRLRGRGNAGVRQALAIELQRSLGNRATRRLLAAPSTARPAPPARGRPIQRMVLPLGDLAELKNSWWPSSESQQASAKVITDAVEKYTKASGDRVARPWDTRSNWVGNAKGAFVDLGLKQDEPIRIYGHGETPEGTEEAAQIGGYTPEALTTTLINLGLPATYTGEIYLTGCLTAVGKDHGYLGKFYALISKHAKGVRVRGNRAETVTFADGRQGVWNGRVDRKVYDATILGIHEKIDAVLEKGKAAKGTIGALGEEMDALLAQGKALEARRAGLKGQPDADLDSAESLFSKQLDDWRSRRLANDSALAEMKVTLGKLNAAKEDLAAQAHDPEPLGTVVLPS